MGRNVHQGKVDSSCADLTNTNGFYSVTPQHSYIQNIACFCCRVRRESAYNYLIRSLNHVNTASVPLSNNSRLGMRNTLPSNDSCRITP